MSGTGEFTPEQSALLRNLNPCLRTTWSDVGQTEDDPDETNACALSPPPPSKHGRQRATIDRDAFAAKRDARRRMAKASRRANR